MPSRPGEGRVDVLGARISNTSPDHALATIRSWVETGRRSYVCVTPVSGVMAARRDPAVRNALNSAGLTVPDGMPIVWAGRYAGANGIARVYGPDLMEAVCAEAAARGWACYFYGGAPGVPERLGSRLQTRFPGLKIAGGHSPPFGQATEGEKAEAASAIARSGARLIWVGLSTPKQDLWMADMVDRIDAPVILLGVGAAFDIHAGLKARPPGWLGPLGLFWLFRLLQEPRRLWRRYLFDIPQFLIAIGRSRPTLAPQAAERAQ